MAVVKTLDAMEAGRSFAVEPVRDVQSMNRVRTHSHHPVVEAPNGIRGTRRRTQVGSKRRITAILGVMMILATFGGAFASYQLGQSAAPPPALTPNSHAVLAGTGNHMQFVRPVRDLALTTFTPPASISDTCATDVTGALNFWFASLPSWAIVNLPHNAC
jgi:hypothetical protein